MSDALSADDRLDILDLMARCARTLDTGDADGFAATFTPEGVLDLDEERLQGHQQLRAYVHRTASDVFARGRQHHVDQVVLEGTSAECRAESYGMCTQRLDHGQCIVVLLGQFADRCVKTDGGWLFAERIWRNWGAPAHG